MLKQLKSWLGLSSRMLVLLSASMLMASCSNPVASLLTGGGPNVAANTQIGKENKQGVNVEYTAPDTTIAPQLRPEGPVDTVNQTTTTTTNNTEIDPLLLILLVLGWLLPSPQEMVRGFVNLFRRNKL